MLNRIPITLRFKDSPDERARYYYYTVPRPSAMIHTTEDRPSKGQPKEVPTNEQRQAHRS